MQGAICADCPDMALVTKCASASIGRAIETMSAHPVASTSSATSGVLIRLDVITGMPTLPISFLVTQAKAARGTDGRRYPWGNQWDKDLCNNKESGPGHTTPVGQYPDGDSPYGVGDMVGQVLEWCQTGCGSTGEKLGYGYPYPYQPGDGREELTGNYLRVARGGSWYQYNPAAVCRCGYRIGSIPEGRSSSWGFRCARTSSS